MPTAVVTGVAGQDGVLLSRLLADRGWSVVGTARPGADSTVRMAPYLDAAGVRVADVDVRDTAALLDVVRAERADAVVNLAGISSVALSWREPERTLAVNGTAVVDLLAGLAALDRPPRLVQASSAEVFGPGGPHDESATPAPANPYGEAKAVAHEAVRAAREDRGAWACSVVLFNHESALRGSGFATRKITTAAAEVARGLRETVALGPVDVRRDWGSAHDHVRAVADLLEQDDPADLVLATGATHALRDVVETAFAAGGVADPWARVESDASLHRPTEVPATVGDASAAERLLGWRPTRPFADVIARMVEVDLRRIDTGVAEHPDYAA